ncbi:unnamed protein product [Vicia faba]|uniref:Uncharacterized protein n=1 Tax=Vicia faba TaxID=3906 RepID=A0AAV0Z0X6_VICFA|nr:unnamed protein product [Vicia faba]
MVSNVSDNIDDVITNFVCADEGSILKKNEVHDKHAPVNEGVIKDVGFSKRYGYPKLIKEFVVKNNGISHGFLNFSYKLFIGKDVLDICPPNVPVIDESGFGNMLTLQSEAIYYRITSFLYQVGTHATL